MADPVTIGVLIAASTAVSVAGSLSAGAAAAAQANTQAQIQQQTQQYNSIVKEQNAQLARQQAGAREQQQRRQSRQVLAQQQAALAQAGIGVGFGSALDIEEQSAVRAELDALTIAYEGELQAQGLLAAAQQDIYMGAAQSEVLRARGASERQASYLSAGASILSGAAQYGSLTGGFGGNATTTAGYDSGARATAFPVSGGGLSTAKRI